MVFLVGFIILPKEYKYVWSKVLSAKNLAVVSHYPQSWSNSKLDSMTIYRFLKLKWSNLSFELDSSLVLPLDFLIFWAFYMTEVMRFFRSSPLSLCLLVLVNLDVTHHPLVDDQVAFVDLTWSWFTLHKFISYPGSYRGMVGLFLFLYLSYSNFFAIWFYPTLDFSNGDNWCIFVKLVCSAAVYRVALILLEVAP